MKRCRELTFVCLLVVTLCSWSFPTAEGTSTNQVLDNGTIVFAPLPTSTQEFVAATYDARGLDGYYSMSNGFTDVVRSGTIPYDIINPLIIDLRNQNAIDQASLIDMILRWYAPILALTILGAVFAILMPLCCCVICCCRCCSKCGADLTWSIDQEDKEGSRRFACWVELVIVILLCILVGVGMVFAFLTNQAIKDTIDNIVPTVNNVLSEAETLANDAVTELTFLNDQFNFTVETVVTQTGDLQTAIVEPLLDMHLPAFNELLEDIENLGDDFRAVNSSLVAVTSNITALNSTAQNISNQLDLLRMQLTNLSTACMASTALMMAGACTNIPNAGSIPDVTGLDELNVAVSTINAFEDSLSFADNLTMIVNQVNTTFRDALNNATAAAEDQVQQAVTGAIDPIRSTTSAALDSFIPIIDQFFNSPPSDNLTFTAQSIQDFISQNINNPALWYSLPNASLAVWVFGLLFCIAVALTLLAIAGGLFCGLVGSSRRRLPYERTRLANCGGVSLLVSVYLIFLTCFVLFILAAILFPFGTTFRKICQSVENPEYEVFEQIVDNEDLWGGTTLINFLIPPETLDADLNFNVQAAFQMCEMNLPLWQAIQADQIIAGVNITISDQTVNLGNLVNNTFTVLDAAFNLTGLIASATDSIGDLNIDAATLIPTDLVDSIRSSLPAELDFGVMVIGTVNSTLMTASMNLSSTSAQLANIVTASEAANETNVTEQAMEVNVTIQTIQGLIDTATMQLGELDASIMGAEAVAQSAVDAADAQINATLDSVPGLVMNVTASLPAVIESFGNTTVGFVEQFVDFTVEALRNDAIQCGSLSNIYVGTINLVCRQNLNSLNGFWFSLGWCALFFIPLAIFLIVLSKHFRQHKDVDEILRTTEYPEYQLETYYNLPAASEAITNQSPQMGAQGRFSKNPDGYPSMLDDPRNGHDDLWIANESATVDF